jgi:hypothetical protein
LSISGSEITIDLSYDRERVPSITTGRAIILNKMVIFGKKKRNCIFNSSHSGGGPPLKVRVLMKYTITPTTTTIRRTIGTRMFMGNPVVSGVVGTKVGSMGTGVCGAALMQSA